MTKQYDQMTTDELNRELAKRLDWRLHTSVPDGCKIESWVNSSGEFQCYKHDWQPCHKDSNQIERFVLPKLMQKGIMFHIEYGDREDYFSVAIKGNYGMSRIVFEIIKLPEGYDLINKTKAIACLKAFDEIEKRGA